MMNSIIVDNLCKSFPNFDGSAKIVLDRVSLKVTADVFTTIIGPNGCGKTTLLNLIAGLSQPDSGTVAIRTDHNNPPRAGLIHQDFRGTLLPWFDVGANITFPLRLRGENRTRRREVAQQLLQDFAPGIMIDQKTYQLSGGQQQMVCLLRSIISEPDFILYDEPTSALDQSRRWSMTMLFEKIWMRRKVPAVFISHDVDEAVMLADKILLMGRAGGAINKEICNILPRPRTVSMLTAQEHIRCREEVIEFLFQEGALGSAAALNNNGSHTYDAVSKQRKKN